ncbi:hypothetical protein [Oceanospirillum beijerinckii]|uniref:hypothetical protein n=1 Tax=Oceanospirillum beijerinckii TaxID=64976 RepID=UPI0004135B99|nr:hypothetical protein [Oceanospirillum beijerinckii]
MTEQTTERRIIADSAAQMDWKDINWFSPDEFPEGVLEHVEAELVLSLEGYRDLLGYPVIPSPLPGGWFRKDGSPTSRHYAFNRLSDGGGVFPQCDIRHAFLVAMSCVWWGGIGVYLDTTGPSGKPEPMLHLDLRINLPKTVWMRYEGRYIYPVRSTAERNEFWQRLAEVSQPEPNPEPQPERQEQAA